MDNVIYACIVCGYRPINQQDFNLHSKRHKKRKRSTSPDPSYDRGRQFKLLCLVCGKRFSEQEDFRCHIEQNHTTTIPTPIPLYSVPSYRKQLQLILRCFVCNKKFLDQGLYRWHVNRHLKRGRKVTIKCELCNSPFKTKSSMEIHMNLVHRCYFCNYQSRSNRKLAEHRLQHRHEELRQCQKGMGKITKRFIRPFKEISAFRGYAKTFRHRLAPEKEVPTINHYFHIYGRLIRNILKYYLDGRKSIKLQISTYCEYIRENIYFDEIEVEECTNYVNSNMKIILNERCIRSVMKQMVLHIKEQVEAFERNGSGWKLNRVLGCDIRMARFHLFRGGCFVPVPEQFRTKRAIVSPQNSGVECFKWAFLILMHYDNAKPTNRGRIQQYKRFEALYNFSGIGFPTSMQDVKKFERQNANKMFAVNVFGIDGRKELNIKHQSIYCRDKSRKVINLLYVQEHHNGIGHWMAITSMSRLLGCHNCHKRFLCYNCFNTFSEEQLGGHEEVCFQFRTQKIVMPEVPETGKPFCEFENYDRKLKTRFVIYADFEALCTDTTRKGSGNSQIISDHQPSGFGIAVVDSYKKKKKVILKTVYRGEDCMEKFIKELDQISANLIDVSHYQKRMRPLTKKQKRKFDNCKMCHICEKRILPHETKVRDHCWVSGIFRAGAHLQCNANYVQFPKIPVVMHNFKNYDCSLLLNNIKKFSDDYVDVIPQTSEKFLSIITQKFYFVDSLMHLTESLDTLTGNLNSTGISSKEFCKRFVYLVQVWGKRKAQRLCRKGVYPYEYMDSWDKFQQTKFPAHKQFYSMLNSRSVSKEDYEYGKQIFKEYCNDLGDYHDLYLLTDTLLLASVFENFRTVGLKNFKLDPVRYFSLAGYAWDAALYTSKQKLELIVDQDMYNLIELGMRGGVSMISQRYAKANNPYMKGFDSSKKRKYILFIDKNNLYGEALLQYLPVGSFAWESASKVRQFTKQKILDWKDDDPIGRILCVDLEYPKELHRDSAHSDYPLAPDKVAIPKSQLSEYQQTLIESYKIKYSDRTKKLIPHLGSRSFYVLHYRNLKYYLQKGMILKRIHSCIRFRQKPWLRGFVLLNASLRRSAQNAFEATLFKNIVNSTFGKSAQQVRNLENVNIVSNLERFKYLSKQSNFKRFEILHPELVIVFRKRPKVILNKPIYTAFTVLELSKLFMYDWHYDRIKLWYGDQAKFLVTDTDSLCYCIETEDLYKDLEKRRNLFDFSEYDPEHFLYSLKNKKTIGKMKDEAKGNIINSFVGLAPKMYSMEGELMRKFAARGVKKAIVKRLICHRKFKDVLFKQRKLICKSNQIRSKNHRLFTANFTKVAMHGFDSKRFILSDGITSLPHNHYKILKK